ncbi:MAG: type II secretion system F family protein [Acidobacteria bacterium]|nr:type II secretion system F family protein [Acidobacteriota bacterium]
MSEYLLKYADARGQIKQEVVDGGSEGEIREKYSSQGFLVYSIKPKGKFDALTTATGGKQKKINLEKFLIFNSQFVTLIRAGLPILKSLDLLATRLTDAKLSPIVTAVRDEVKIGTSLSDAFSKQNVFPPVYVTSVLAGEKSGSLIEVLDRYIAYQKMTLAVKKKLLVSLMYPCLLILLVLALVAFLIAYVVPQFSELYKTMDAQLPIMTVWLIAFGEVAQNYIWWGLAIGLGGAIGFFFWSRTDHAQELIDRMIMRTPLAGEIWIKYQVAQFSRVLSTLLLGGIPLVQALETAGNSVGTKLLGKALTGVRQSVREGNTLSDSLKETKLFPALSIDMIEVGESTGALPSMLASVAEFYEDDVQTKLAAALSLIEPGIMVFMGVFVAFVLVALYLPIFSLSDVAGGR